MTSITKYIFPAILTREAIDVHDGQHHVEKEIINISFFDEGFSMKKEHIDIEEDELSSGLLHREKQ